MPASDVPEIKDSGKRQEFKSGMVRDVTDDKVDYTLILDGPMFERWAQHITTGAKKYDARNWMKARGQEELDRFIQSAIRHMIQYVRGDTDEDHAAAVYFNLNGAEYVKGQMGYGLPTETSEGTATLDIPDTKYHDEYHRTEIQTHNLVNLGPHYHEDEGRGRVEVSNQPPQPEQHFHFQNGHPELRDDHNHPDGRDHAWWGAAT